jgi:hypothetical protein
MENQVVDLSMERERRRPLDYEEPRKPYDSTGVTSQAELLNRFEEIASNITHVFNKSQIQYAVKIGVIKLNILPNKRILRPIEAILEQDEDGFIARTIEIPLYGHGLDPVDAIQSLKHEVESLYDDLMEDDEYTDYWLKIKEYLKNAISD